MRKSDFKNIKLGTVFDSPEQLIENLFRGFLDSKNYQLKELID